jgi:hypothetical protein
VKKWTVRRVWWKYCCHDCGCNFDSKQKLPSRQKYGRGLMSWCVYYNVAFGLNMLRVHKSVEDIFGLRIADKQLYRWKSYVAAAYHSLCAEILQHILNSGVIHIDETTVRLRGHCGYVWVLATMDAVYYFYKASREGSFLREMLGSFSGILISDFYTAYDTLDCQQQKCLVHFIRDIDDDLLRNPLDTELKTIAQQFGIVLRSIIETVDRYGLKRRHLNKHKRTVYRFLKSVASRTFSSELANKYKKRFHKSGQKMFTFLDHDGVPWNNTNAEHAIKRFAKFRRTADGYFTERTLNEYLVLATVLETCAFNNVNILKFLLSDGRSLTSLFRMAGRKI